MSDTTAAAMIEALRRLPPETVLRAEGGLVGVLLPEPSDVHVAGDGTPWVVIT